MARVQWYVVLILLLVTANLATAILLSDFYPFGLNSGDTLLAITDNGSSGIVTPRRFFPFYGIDHFTIVVSLSY